MDSFERIVASILDRQGFWTRTEVKVELTKQEKREIGRPSSPRWEIDVVGYKASTNEIRVVECKSYLDSTGVAAKDVIDPLSPYSGRFKLFHEHRTRKTVLNRLALQFEEAGLCQSRPTITLCLAAGNVRNQSDLGLLHRHFDSRGWVLIDPESIRAELQLLGKSGYENSVAAVTAKILLRETVIRSRKS